MTDLEISELEVARFIIRGDYRYLYKCKLLRGNVLRHMNLETQRLRFRCYNIGAG